MKGKLRNEGEKCSDRLMHQASTERGCTIPQRVRGEDFLEQAGRPWDGQGPGRKHSSEEASRHAHAFQDPGIAGRSVLKVKGLPGWGCWDEALSQAGCRA